MVCKISVRKIYFLYVGGIMMKMGMKKIIATAVAGVFFSGMPIGSSVSEASDWGKIADIVIFDPEKTYKIDKTKFASKGRNTPFDGREVTGKVMATIVDGRVVYEAEA